LSWRLSGITLQKLQIPQKCADIVIRSHARRDGWLHARSTRKRQRHGEGTKKKDEQPQDAGISDPGYN